MRWWPFGRSAGEPSAAAPAPSTSAASGPPPASNDWRDVPRLQRTLADPLAPVAINDRFREGLATSADPSFLAPLTHRVEPVTGGLVEGLVVPGRPTTHGGPDLVVPSRPAAATPPRVQRLAQWSDPGLATVPLEYPAPGTAPAAADGRRVDEVGDAEVEAPGPVSIDGLEVVAPESAPTDPAATIDQSIAATTSTDGRRSAAPTPVFAERSIQRSASDAEPSRVTLGPRLLGDPLIVPPVPITPRVAATTEPPAQPVSYAAPRPDPAPTVSRRALDPSGSAHISPAVPTVQPTTEPANGSAPTPGVTVPEAPVLRHLPTLSVARIDASAALPTLVATGDRDRDRSRDQDTFAFGVAAAECDGTG